MNTKGMKFLAVLAVLAMAFAGFAVIADAQQNDAGIAAQADYYDKDGTADAMNVYSVTGTGLSADASTISKFVITGDDVTITSTVGASKTPIIYVLPDKEFTITVTPSTWSSFTVISATATNAKITPGEISMTFTSATNLKVAADADGNITLDGANDTTVAKSSAMAVGDATLAFKAGGVILNGTLENKGTLLFNGGTVLVNGGSITTAGSTKGAVRITEHPAFEYDKDGTYKAAGVESAAIVLLGGSLNNQIVTLTQNSDKADVKVAYGEEFGNLTADVSITNNEFRLVNENKVISIAKPSAESEIAVNINGNVFTSIVAVDSLIQVGRGSAEAADMDVKITISNNDFSGIAGYNKSATTAGKTDVVFNSTGNVIGTALTTTNGVNVKLSSNTDMGIGFRQMTTNNIIKESLTVKYLGVDSTKAVDIAANTTLSVEKSIRNLGAINNNATLEIKGSVEALGTINNIGENATVKYGDKEAEVETADTAAAIKDLVEDEDTKSAIITIAAGSSTQTTVAVGTKDVAIDINTVAVSKLDFAVAEGGSISIAATANYSGVITAGTQKITMTNVQGAFTIVPGSIVIDGEVKGDIVLENGAELKVKETLTITGASSISVATPASETATIIIEENAVATLNDTLTISGGITVKVYGKVTGTGTISVAKEIDTFDGSIVNVNTVTGAGKIVAYSGSDINGIDTLSITTITGKDAASGTWIIDGTTLILTNYNGTYNFYPFADALTEIIVNGECSVSYAFEAEFEDTNFVMFGQTAVPALTSITSDDTGSLDISVDLSNIDGAQLFQTGRLTVISAGAINKINGADVSITVFGTNGTWTDDQTKAAQVTGINAASIVTYDAEISVDVFSSYTSSAATKVIGINSTGVITIDKADILAVTSAGAAVNSGGKITISNSGAVTIDGKKSGINSVAAQDLEFTTVPSVNVKGGANITGLLTQKVDEAKFAGTVTVATITENNSSTVKFTGTTTITGAVQIKQESVLEIKNATLSGAITNGGTVNFIGNVTVLDPASIVNNKTMTNGGILGIYGDFTNNGDFTNSGTLNVYKYKFAATTQTFTVAADDLATATTNVKLKSLQLSSTAANNVVNADGSVTLKGITASFFTNAAGVYVADYADKYSGTLTPSNDGGYVLNISNKTSTIAITYSILTTGAGNEFGKSYAISTTGSINDGVNTYGLEGNKTGEGAKEITDNFKTSTFIASEATFVTNADATFTNTGSVIVSSNYNLDPAVAANIVKGEYNGPLTTYIDAATITGEFTGDLTAKGEGAVTIGDAFIGAITAQGAVVVNADATVEGNITTEAGVTSNGEIVGDISAKGAVTVTDFLGTITVEVSAADTNVTVKGDASGELVYISKYKATKDAETKTEYTNKMSFIGESTGDGYVIVLVKGSDATDSKEVVPGFFKIGAMNDLAAGKTVDLTLTEGKVLVDSAVVLKSRYSLTIEAETTIEVNKSAASLDVRNAALKVSKDATANFETGTATPVNYGKVLFIMSFSVNDGAYTIYSNVAYALSNCDEGSELTVGENAAIDQSVTVPAGVNIIVNNVTLTFDGFTVEMGDGAKITLEGTGKLVFAASGDNTADPALEIGDLYDYYSVSGTIVFGDNIVELLGVRFTAESTIVGVAATESVPAKISTTLLYNEGFATIAAGVGTGSITLANDIYPLIKGDAASDVAVTATFTVAEGAVFDAVSITDAFEVVDYDENGEIVDVVKFPTYVYVDGILNLTNNTEIKGCYAGDGTVTLAAGKQIVLVESDLVPVAPGPYTNKTAPASLAVTIVDTTDDANGYVFIGGAMAGETVTLKATTYKLGTETLNVMTISGDLGLGMVTATTVAFLDELTIEEDAAVIADETYLVNNDSIATGYLMTKELYQKSTEYAALKELTYEVTFESEGYTVYTKFATVDFDEVSDITIADNFNLDDLTGGDANAKYDLSGKDITITVAEGKVLTVNQKLIIGTPMTTLGGSAVISGTLKITGGNYIVAYSNVDLYDANILQNDGETVAVNSILTIEDVLYATLFANDGTIAAGFVLADADKTLVPEIAGFNFTKWYNLNEAAASLIGETNAYAGVKATLVTVTVKFAEGVSYYLNGTEFAIYDTPTKVDYNSVFTAKINNTAKYQGTPLVNGQNSFQVTENATLTVTGVEPIPEPEPAPAGMSLTEILLIVLVVLIAIMVVIIALRLNRS